MGEYTIKMHSRISTRIAVITTVNSYLYRHGTYNLVQKVIVHELLLIDYLIENNQVMKCRLPKVIGLKGRSTKSTTTMPTVLGYLTARRCSQAGASFFAVLRNHDISINRHFRYIDE